ncbi:uncharacterized protein LOC135682657 [Rhopilema esculentum]|uniref:uncharacterized protein LOC135682657 n=1 Tax=Rhopilema esculentum TaxID=499914 RepID=UPI0031CF0C73
MQKNSGNMLFIKGNILFVLLSRFRLTAALVDCPAINVRWWENKPYIYKDGNGNGNPTGALPLLFNGVGKQCCKALSVNWAHQFKTYKEALNEVESIRMDGSTDNSSVDIWLPFSVLNSGNVSQINIMNSSQIVIIVIETRMDKLKFVYEGFKRITPQIIMILMLTIFFGILIWIAETRSNSQFPAPFPRGAWHGFWWAIVTVTTVGYGDKSPRTGVGRFIGIIWMVTGLVLFPVLTAEVTSILTDNSYSLVLKKAGVLKNSLEIRHAIDHGAFVHECDSYDHCLQMLVNESIQVMLVDVHVAVNLQSSNIVQKGHITAKIPINAFIRKRDESKIKDFHDCINRNPSAVTESLKKVQNDVQLIDFRGVIFSTGTKEIALILFGFVVAVYLLVLIADTAMRYKKKKNKIGDFREGVFMENKVIKNGSEQDIQEHEDPTEQLRQLLKKQRQQLADLQQSFEELEKRVDI